MKNCIFEHVSCCALKRANVSLTQPKLLLKVKWRATYISMIFFNSVASIFFKKDSIHTKLWSSTQASSDRTHLSHVKWGRGYPDWELLNTRPHWLDQFGPYHRGEGVAHALRAHVAIMSAKNGFHQPYCCSRDMCNVQNCHKNCHTFRNDIFLNKLSETKSPRNVQNHFLDLPIKNDRKQ